MARKITVLLVEGDLIVRDALQHALVMENFHVLTAASLAEARQHARTTAIEIVLIDAELSVMDGGETLAEMKSRHPFLSVIVMTADDSFAWRSPQVNALVEKPLNLPALFEKIEDLANGALSTPRASGW